MDDTSILNGIRKYGRKLGFGTELHVIIQAIEYERRKQGRKSTRRCLRIILRQLPPTALPLVDAPRQCPHMKDRIIWVIGNRDCLFRFSKGEDVLSDSFSGVVV